MWIVMLLLAALTAVAIAVVGFVYLAPERVARLAIGAERRRADLSRQDIDLPGGLHYAYLEGGRGEPLLLLHGFGADKDNFNRVARLLTPRYRVIVPDHIGFGESAHPHDADYAPPAQAERLHALAQALGLTRLHLGGSSMGGQIAMTYAARYPAEVASLWLLDPAGVWSAPESEFRTVFAATGRNPLMARSEQELAQVLAFVMHKPPYIPRPILTFLARERIRNFALEERIFAQVTDDSVEARVAGLATPSLIVWGDQDRAIHVATAGVLHQLLPHSQVIIMRGVGHLPMLERPQQSAEDYLRFRASL
jgi:pimeloyl-ACP methyl ester carboxylesterase